MNRRRFFKYLAASAAALALAAEAPWKLNYILASAMYGNLPLAEILPEVKKGGATSLDLWPKKWGTQREEIDAIGHDKFAAMLKEHGISLGRMTRYDLGAFGLTDEIGITQKLGGTIMKPMSKDEKLQQMPGFGSFDYKQINFTGPTEIFMHPTPRGIPILPTAAETTAEIVRARKHLDQLL